MRGIVYTTDGVEITEELSVRDPGPKEVRVRIGAAGVCHSDLSVINRTIPFPPPVVLGHEGAGVVEAVGADVRSVKVGDHVVIATLANCGTCRACSAGHPTQCRRSLGNIDTPFTFKGQPAYNFAAASVFAESTVVQEVQAVKIPKDVPLTSACLIACGVLTGVGAVLNRARVRPGETAAVFGVGGVTWAFDCVGHPAVLRSALDCLDWGGNAVAIGIPPQGTEVAVDVNALAYVDRGLMGNRYGSARPHHDIPLMIDLYQSGRLLLDELVSLTRPLEAFGEIVDEMEAGRVARGVLTFD
jgi:Zn-dependent alcohol dehydrogenase